jgi:hypothetical protein
MEGASDWPVACVDRAAARALQGSVLGVIWGVLSELDASPRPPPSLASLPAFRGARWLAASGRGALLCGGALGAFEGSRCALERLSAQQNRLNSSVAGALAGGLLSAPFRPPPLVAARAAAVGALLGWALHDWV